VLEPLSGYLVLGAALNADVRLHGEAFNFGPRAEQTRTVLDLIKDIAQKWTGIAPADAVRVIERKPFHEAGLLKLNCDKALFQLRWEANLSYREMIGLIVDWYRSYFAKNSDMYEFTVEQIASFEAVAAKNGRSWSFP
jgi:CDP-glucose 4,6-dehydratase